MLDYNKYLAIVILYNDTINDYDLQDYINLYSSLFKTTKTNIINAY